MQLARKTEYVMWCTRSLPSEIGSDEVDAKIWSYGKSVNTMLHIYDRLSECSWLPSSLYLCRLVKNCISCICHVRACLGSKTVVSYMSDRDSRMYKKFALFVS